MWYDEGFRVFHQVQQYGQEKNYGPHLHGGSIHIKAKMECQALGAKRRVSLLKVP